MEEEKRVLNEDLERIQGDDQKRTEAFITNFETQSSQISTQIANITQIGLLGNTLDNPNNKSRSATKSRSRTIAAHANPKSTKEKMDRQHDKFLKLMGKLQIIFLLWRC